MDKVNVFRAADKAAKKKKSSFIEELEYLFQDFAESGRLREYFTQLEPAEQAVFAKNMVPYVEVKAKDRLDAETRREKSATGRENDARHLAWYRQLVRKMTESAGESDTSAKSDTVGKICTEPVIRMSLNGDVGSVSAPP